jgi:hypothetical protein
MAFHLVKKDGDRIIQVGMSLAAYFGSKTGRTI